MPGAADRGAVQVDCAGIHQAVQLDSPAPQLLSVGGADAGRLKVGTGALHVAAEHRPALYRLALRGRRERDAHREQQAHEDVTSHARIMRQSLLDNWPHQSMGSQSSRILTGNRPGRDGPDELRESAPAREAGEPRTSSSSLHFNLQMADAGIAEQAGVTPDFPLR